MKKLLSLMLIATMLCSSIAINAMAAGEMTLGEFQDVLVGRKDAMAPNLRGIQTEYRNISNDQKSKLETFAIGSPSVPGKLIDETNVVKPYVAYNDYDAIGIPEIGDAGAIAAKSEVALVSFAIADLLTYVRSTGTIESNISDVSCRIMGVASNASNTQTAAAGSAFDVLNKISGNTLNVANSGKFALGGLLIGLSTEMKGLALKSNNSDFTNMFQEPKASAFINGKEGAFSSQYSVFSLIEDASVAMFKNANNYSGLSALKDGLVKTGALVLENGNVKKDSPFIKIILSAFELINKLDDSYDTAATSIDVIMSGVMDTQVEISGQIAPILPNGTIGVKYDGTPTKFKVKSAFPTKFDFTSWLSTETNAIPGLTISPAAESGYLTITADKNSVTELICSTPLKLYRKTTDTVNNDISRLFMELNIRIDGWIEQLNKDITSIISAAEFPANLADINSIDNNQIGGIMDKIRGASEAYENLSATQKNDATFTSKNQLIGTNGSIWSKLASIVNTAIPADKAAVDNLSDANKLQILQAFNNLPQGAKDFVDSTKFKNLINSFKKLKIVDTSDITSGSSGGSDLAKTAIAVELEKSINLISLLNGVDIEEVRLELHVNPAPKSDPVTAGDNKYLYDASKAFSKAMTTDGFDVSEFFNIYIQKTVTDSGVTVIDKLSNALVVKPVTMRIPISNSLFKNDKIAVYYINDAGVYEKNLTAKKVTGTNKQSYIEFDAAHFSYYAIVDETVSGSDGGIGGGGTPSTYYTVTYESSQNGKISEYANTERILSGNKPLNVPLVTPKDSYKFIGWSLDKDSKVLVDPKAYVVKANTTFWAVLVADLIVDKHLVYIKGYDDDTFKPDSNITRAEISAIFARLIKGKTEENMTNTASKFSDVDANSWYAKYVCVLEDFGIIVGDENALCRPDQPITRAEFATIASRFAGLEMTTKTAFSDLPATHWAFSFINSAYEKGWINGYSDGSFKPDNEITRAEAVKIVNTMLDRIINAASIENATPHIFNDLTAEHWAYYFIIEASNAHEFDKTAGQEIWVK